MKRKLLSCCAVLMTATLALLVAAPAIMAEDAAPKDLKPLVTVSFAGYDRVKSDVALVGKLSDNPELADQLEAQLQAAIGEGTFKAIDKSKPWGAVVSTDPQGQEFYVQGFVPTKDVKQLLKTMEAADITAKEEDGLFTIQAPFGEVFVKQRGAWAVFATKKEALAVIPEDPATMLGDLAKQYTLAVKISAANAPEGLRQKGVELLNFGMMLGMQRQPGEGDEQFEMRQKMTKQGMEQLTKLINELDTILVGLGVNQEAKQAFLEYMVTAKEGTETAKKMQSAAKPTSRFAGLLKPGAAMNLSVSSKIDQSDVAQLKTNLAVVRATIQTELDKQNLPEDKAAKAKRIIGDLFDVIEKSAESGEMDLAATLTLKPDAALLVSGFAIAEGAKLEKAIKDLVEEVKTDAPPVANLIKLNAEEYQGIRFHVVSVPIEMVQESEREKVTKLLGDPIQVIVGIGENAAYVAGGKNASQELKKAIDAAKAGADKKVPPAQVIVSLTPILEFAASVADENDREQIQNVVKMLKAAEGKDQIRMVGTLIPNGSKVRIELDAGILKILGNLPQIMNQ